MIPTMCRSPGRIYSIRFILLFISAIFILSLPIEAFSQNAKSLLKKHLHFSGQSSIYGELYSITGASRRRPPATGRISISPNLSISRYVNISGQIMLSTEGSSGRQNINILGLHPVWQWGSAHLGDYSNHFSRYSLNGVNIKGAEINLFPGQLRFSLGGGQTKRAVGGILVHESFDQYLIASRIGYGKENGSFFDLVFLKAKDDESSLKKPEEWDYPYVIPDTLETELDTLWIEPPYNPLSVTPQENMVIGFASKISLLKNRLIFEIEGNGSAFTKDITAAQIEMDSIEARGLMKDFFRGFFVPRAGSNFDYAVNTNMKMNLTNLKLNAGFRRIGPGYVSLGIPSTVNDRQELLLNTTLRLGPNRFRINWNRLSDNLLNQKQQTNTRDQFQGSIATHTKRWRSQFNVRYLVMCNETPVDSMEWQFDNFIFTTHQSLVFGRESVFRQVGLQYTFQTSRKEMFEQPKTNHYHTVNFTANVRFVKYLNLNTSVGLSFRDSNTQGKYTTQVYSVRLMHVAFKNKLSNALLCSSSMVRDTRMFRAGINTSYRLTKSYRLVFNLSYNDFRGPRNFKEYRSTMMLSHQF